MIMYELKKKVNRRQYSWQTKNFSNPKLYISDCATHQGHSEEICFLKIAKET